MTMPTPPPEPTLGGLFRQAALKALAVVAFVIAVVGIYAWSQRRGQPVADPRAAAAAWCAAQYARATSAAESSAVDARRAPSGGGTSSTDRLCREVRPGDRAAR